MKNKYPAKCFICKHPVGPGDGYAEMRGGRWYARHAGCRIEKK